MPSPRTEVKSSPLLPAGGSHVVPSTAGKQQQAEQFLLATGCRTEQRRRATGVRGVDVHAALSARQQRLHAAGSVGVVAASDSKMERRVATWRGDGVRLSQEAAQQRLAPGPRPSPRSPPGGLRCVLPAAARRQEGERRGMAAAAAEGAAHPAAEPCRWAGGSAAMSVSSGAGNIDEERWPAKLHQKQRQAKE